MQGFQITVGAGDGGAALRDALLVRFACGDRLIYRLALNAIADRHRGELIEDLGTADRLSSLGGFDVEKGLHPIGAERDPQCRIDTFGEQQTGEHPVLPGVLKQLADGIGRDAPLPPSRVGEPGSEPDLIDSSRVGFGFQIRDQKPGLRFQPECQALALLLSAHDPPSRLLPPVQYGLFSLPLLPELMTRAPAANG